MTSCFADRLGEIIRLSADERAALAALEEDERRVRRLSILVREGDVTGELFIVKSGMLMSYVVVDDGSRQILRFLLPGDVVGVSSLVYGRATESVIGLADSVVCPFDRDAIGRLALRHPRLTAAMLAWQQIEHVALTDRLASLGRTCAKARVAAVLLELRDRLHRGTGDAGFAIGLTQEEIGDATGLTAVHVNRMLRQLGEEGLIARSNGQVSIVDATALARAANYVDRQAGMDLGWLSSAA